VRINANYSDGKGISTSEQWVCGTFGHATCAGGGARNYTTWFESYLALDTWTGHGTQCDNNIREQNWSGTIRITSTISVSTGTNQSPLYNLCDRL
jgi:hypothetical protein